MPDDEEIWLPPQEAMGASRATRRLEQEHSAARALIRAPFATQASINPMISHSLANFIFQNETNRFQPQESSDQYNLPLTATPSDFYDARSVHDTRSFPADRNMWESAVAEAVFDSDRQLREITLYPISLGFGDTRTRRGGPVPATASLAAAIIDRIATLSKPYGTKILYQDGKGVGEFPR
jgi:poly-gamma-glutamate synthesis protein (capsule biosynthesis protein)